MKFIGKGAFNSDESGWREGGNAYFVLFSFFAGYAPVCEGIYFLIFCDEWWGMQFLLSFAFELYVDDGLFGEFDKDIPTDFFFLAGFGPMCFCSLFLVLMLFLIDSGVMAEFSGVG